MPDTSTLDIVDAVYLLSVLADQPRSIDRFIDYFGGARDLNLRERGEEVWQ